MIVVGGESLIDFIERPGAGPNPLFEAFPGGSPFNCALAMARLGARSGFCGPFSQDRLGVLMREHLQASGAYVVLGEPSRRPSSLAIVSLGKDGQASYRFEREGTAEHDIDAGRVMEAMPAEANVFHTGSLAIIADADAAVWREVAERVIARGGLLSLDPNVRPRFIPDLDAHRARLETFFGMASIVKLSDEDLGHLGFDPDPEALRAHLIANHGVRLVAVTRGSEGATLLSPEAQADVPAFLPPKLVDTIGAGDTFMAGLLARLAERGPMVRDRLAALGAGDLADLGRFAAIAAGLNCAEQGCDPPQRERVAALMG